MNERLPRLRFGLLIPEHLQENVAIAEKGPLPADVYAEAKRRLDQTAA